MKLESWGRFPQATEQTEITPIRPNDVADILQQHEAPLLPRGLGRSYGDVCLNEQGTLLSSRWLDKFIHFDDDTGVLRCEAGVSLDDILQTFVPRGWFLPVTPGTKFVTLGGAIANDVHGKNHHVAGNIGNHVRRLRLARSDCSIIECSPEQNADWFRASIGGLGLTGMILDADLQLKRIDSAYLRAEALRFRDLDEFSWLSQDSDRLFEYTVAWLDCANFDNGLGSGVFFRGKHRNTEGPANSWKGHANPKWKSVPFDAPGFLLSPPMVRLFNRVYAKLQKADGKQRTVHYDRFFYPLDGVHHWNRLYGKRGFLQWQCVTPRDAGIEPIKAVLNALEKQGIASYLVVLKAFGDQPAAGLMSFPMPGFTLAMDFPNTGQPLFDLLQYLDRIVIEAGGRIYPAKDARMAPETFRRSFSQLAEFAKFIDPKFSSSFYRRVCAHGDE